MKILNRNKKHGLVKVVVEVPDDLWYLYTIIEKGDRCTGESEYKFKLGEEKTRIVKKKVWVTIEVEKTEFHQHSGQLRLLGLVVDGSEVVPRGSYHTIDVQEGSQLKILKEWRDYHNEKLEESVKSAKLKTLLVLFDRESALFALLKPNGYQRLLELKGDVPKKGFDENKTHSFYKDIIAKIQEYTERYSVHRTIAASPSFWKEYLRKEMTKDMEKKIIFAGVSSVDENAISELLKRPELKQALEGERSAREVEIVEKILDALGKDKLAYGIDDVASLVSEGNVSEVTVTEKCITQARAEGTFGEMEKVMRKASDLKAKIHLLSTDAMQKVDGIGGIVAIRRW